MLSESYYYLHIFDSPKLYEVHKIPTDDYPKTTKANKLTSPFGNGWASEGYPSEPARR